MVDVLLVNPPSPDGSVIIRDLNRSGRTSKERIIWPQVNLAYLAAVIDNKFSVEIVDCITENMNWQEFEGYLLQILNVLQKSLFEPLRFYDWDLHRYWFLRFLASQKKEEAYISVYLF